MSAVERPLHDGSSVQNGLRHEQGAATAQTLVRGNGEGVERLHPQPLSLLEDGPRAARPVLDQHLAVGVGTGILPLVGRREQSTALDDEGVGLGVVDHGGLIVRRVWLTLGGYVKRVGRRPRCRTGGTR